MKKKSNFARHCLHHSSTPSPRLLLAHSSFKVRHVRPPSPDSRTINQEQERGRSDRLKVKRRVLNLPASYPLGWGERTWESWDGAFDPDLALSWQNHSISLSLSLSRLLSAHATRATTTLGRRGESRVRVQHSFSCHDGGQTDRTTDMRYFQQ